VWFGRDNNRPIGKGATGGATAAPAFAYFFRKLYKMYPNLPRKFEVPEGVYSSQNGVVSELYTDISPLPTKAETSTEQEFPDMF
jgi:penicillin-binding protein 1A